MIIGCAQVPPNDPVCFPDAPAHANCTYMVENTQPDFPVDNTGDSYTVQGDNWTYDQLVQNTLWVSPQTYGDIKDFFLNYCQQNSGVCNYTQAQAAFADFESKHPQFKQP